MKRKVTLLLTLALLCALLILFFRPDRSRPYLTVMGYVRMADGLGRQTVELIDALKDDMSIGFIPTHNNQLQDVPKRLHKILNNRKRPIGKVVVFEDCLWYPEHTPFKKLITVASDDQIRIAYSMFESSRIPPEWTHILNLYFDAVAVPDPFLIKVYQDSGVALPIFVVPLAIDLSPFLKEPLKTAANTPFTFANLSTCVDRKNQLTLLRAFAQAFGNSPEVKLLIHARASYNNLDAILREEIQKLGLSNVDFNISPLPAKEYLALFRTVDAYVNLSKGEGFSIQPREAMALGIPTAVSNNTAQKRLVASNLVVPVASTIEKPAFYDWGSYYGNSYDCSEDDAAAALKEVYFHYDAYLKWGKEARAFAAQSQCSALMPLYRTLVKPKRIVLGAENTLTEETLTTNSETLYRKYVRLTQE